MSAIQPWPHHGIMARYNQWANQRLYEACARLSEADYFKERRAFFGSIHGTLNHGLVADRLWLDRLGWKPAAIDSLDQELHRRLPALGQARAELDAFLIDRTDGLTEADLARVAVYRPMAAAMVAKGGETRTAVHWVLTHMANHQTHHRGQVHDMLSQTPVAPPSLDLIYYLRR